VVLRGKELQQRDNWCRAYLLPGPDGQVLFSQSHNDNGFNCTSGVLYTTEFKVISGGERGGKDRGLCPSHQGQFYVDVCLDSPTPQLVFYVVGDTRPFATLKGAGIGRREWDNGGNDFDKRLYVLPEAGRIVTIPAGNDRLEVHRFDVNQALEKSDIDYLLITTRPPFSARKGEKYVYQLAVKSKKGGVQYKVESGSAGMKISPKGEVTWDVPADFRMSEAAVILTVSDKAGQEVFQHFRIRVTAPENP
jgi:hypothetical protein